jgi:hypothetical protein
LGSWHSTTELRPQVITAQVVTLSIYLLMRLVAKMAANFFEPDIDCSGWHHTGQDDTARTGGKIAGDKQIDGC